MEKLPMCRICLVQNVRMFVVVNRNLHELYEKLTDIPFVTEDSRPILACFFCYAKLKQCNRLLRQCLEAEELFAQMMNEDYEPNPLINQDHFKFCSGFIRSPTENISIVDEIQTESIAIKEDLPAVCEGLDDIIEPKEEHQSDELEPENLDNSCVEDVADHSESDLEDDVLIMEFKTEVEEEQGVSKNKRRARETERATVAKKPKLEDATTAKHTRKGNSNELKGATVAKEPKLDTRRTKLEDTTTAEQTKKGKSDSNVIRTIQKRTSEPGTYFKESSRCDQSSFHRVKKNIQHTRKQIGGRSYKCDVCQRSFSRKGDLTNHIRTHTGEKPYKCDVCQRSFSLKGNLSKHIRRHTSETLHKCDVCQRSFSRSSHLKRHNLTHTGEKPYKCDVCQRSFNQKCNLTAHNIRLHTSETLHKCDVCQRSFSRKGDLTNHIRIHTGEKVHKCDVCQRSFIEKCNLTKHIRSHTGEKL